MNETSEQNDSIHTPNNSESKTQAGVRFKKIRFIIITIITLVSIISAGVLLYMGLSDDTPRDDFITTAGILFGFSTAVQTLPISNNPFCKKKNRR